MTKRILLISYYFYPDSEVGSKRPTQLAETLNEAGWDVDVLTKYIGRSGSQVRANSDSKVKVYSLYQHPGIVNPIWSFLKRIGVSSPSNNDVYPSNIVKPLLPSKESWKTRIKRYILSAQATLSACKSWIAISILFLLFLKIRKKNYDVVLSTSPVAASHFLALFARNIFDAKWILDVRDPINMWDEVLPICMSKPRFLLENFLEKKYYEECDLIVVTSPSLKIDLHELSGVSEEKIRLIYNGYDGALKYKPIKTGKKIKMIYAGAIYMNRNPFPIFEAIKELAQEGVISAGSFAFDLFGECHYWKGNDLRNWVKSNKLSEFINFGGNLPGPELDVHIEAADIVLNLAQGQKKQIPAKTFEYLRYSAIHFLISEHDSDTSKFISENHFGVVAGVTKEEVKKVLERIIRASDKFQVSDRVTQNKKRFSRKRQNEIYLTAINDMALK